MVSASRSLRAFSSSLHSIRDPRLALRPRDLLDLRLPAQVGRVHVCPATGVHLRAHDIHDAELLPRRHEAPVGDEALESAALEVVLVPPLDLHGHRLRHVRVYLVLDRRLPLALDRPLELARRAVREVRRLELVEALDLLLQQVPDRRAQDVARRVEPRVQQALVHVDGLLDLVACLERRGARGEAPKVQHLAVLDGVHARSRHGERGGLCRAGQRDRSGVRGLAAALGVENGLARDDDVVLVGAFLEQQFVGLLQGRERPDGGHDGAQLG